MSRIASAGIAVPKGVDVAVDGPVVRVRGKHGELEFSCADGIAVSQDESTLRVATKRTGRQARALAGTTRAHIQNMVMGVSDLWRKNLELQGVGYRAQASGQAVNLQIGYSHPVEFRVPDGVKVETPTVTEIVVSGIDRQLVGQVSAEIRALRPPEPYKGKGIRYRSEYVRQKEGKKK